MNKLFATVAVIIVLAFGGLIILINSSPNSATVSETPEAVQRTTTTGTAGDTVVIETSGFQFAPNTIRIKAGGTITFTNKDSVAHTFTSDDKTSFDSGNVAKDQTVTITAPNEPGEYPFHCTPHPQMKGTLIVE